MAVVDLPIGLMYGVVLAGFVLMTWRAIGVARANWRRGASVLEQPELADGHSRRVDGRDRPTRREPGRIQAAVPRPDGHRACPVAIAMAGSSLIFVMATGTVPDFVVIHRMVNGIDSFPLLAVPFFILAGNLMNSAGITNRIYNFALALVGLAARRPRPCERAGLDDLRRHVGHRDRRCGGPRHDRDQGDEGPRLQRRVRRRRDRRVGDARARSFRRRCRS